MIEFTIKHTESLKILADCAIVGVYEQEKMSSAAKTVDEQMGGILGSAVKEKEVSGKAGDATVLHSFKKGPYKRIITVGLGKKESLDIFAYQKILQAAAKALSKTRSKIVANYLTTLTLKKIDIAQQIAQAVRVFESQFYQFQSFKTVETSSKYPQKVVLITLPQYQKIAKIALKYGQALAEGILFTKNLANLPANICTPSYLATNAIATFKKTPVHIQVLKEKDLVKLGMNAFLSVAQGSQEAPHFIVLTYQNAPTTTKPIVLVGKGITFDSGGISLKPSLGMQNMKYDMCGAATVLGAFKALLKSELPLNLVGLIPACENLPSGRATKPGDIIKTMSGITVEIFNTDAEGRLILSDALHYAKQFDPSCIIDMATLTGACVATFGQVSSALFTNCDDLQAALLKASQISGDRIWPMPLWEEYGEPIKGMFADLVNIGGPTAGSITAAKFLSHFIGEYRWAHLDIAGTAYDDKTGATGRPLPLIMAFLEKCANKAL